MQFRLNLVLAARDSGELRTWVSAQPEHLLQRAEPIVQTAVVREQGMLPFPALHQWVTPAEAYVYETASKLLTAPSGSAAAARPPRGNGRSYRGRRIVCRAVLFRLGTDGPACEKKNSDCAAVIHKEKPRRFTGGALGCCERKDQINISAGERTSRAASPHARGRTRCVCGARGSARGCAYAAPCTCGSPQPPRTGTGRRRPGSCP